MLNVIVNAGIVMVIAAMLASFWRSLRGPTLPDRVMGLDTLYINSIALLVLLGIGFDSTLFLEIALLIALIGFISTVALCKYLLRGNIVE